MKKARHLSFSLRRSGILHPSSLIPHPSSTVTTTLLPAAPPFHLETEISALLDELSSVQTDVFKRSLSGPVIRRYLNAQLIEPTPADKKVNQHETIKSRRQRELDEAFGSAR